MTVNLTGNGAEMDHEASPQENLNSWKVLKSPW